jgi:uncharacterized damage-inducible protein DinB
MRTLVSILLFCLLAPASVALAEENPLSAHNRHLYGGVRQILVRTAEKMPEANYGFKPTEGVRTFGQIVGHAADAQYAFCSVVLGEKNPSPKIEKTKTSKADLVAALGDAVAYCDRAHASITDKSGSETVKLMGGDMPKFGVLTVNSIHSIEHYGNLVVYLRMNGIVPPTSDAEFMKELYKK